MPIITQNWMQLKTRDLIELQCDYCSIIFTKTKNRIQDKIANNTSNKFFCSSNCCNSSRKSKIKTKCLNCHKELLLVPSVLSDRNFCSHSCATKTNNSQNRRWSRPESKYSSVKLCKTCKNPSSKNIYCSKECNPRRILLSEENKKKRSKAMHNEAWHRYMARRKNQTPQDADFKGMQQFYINCPCGYEVDHIIPVSKGGSHTLANLQYLTVLENRKKSNKM